MTDITFEVNEINYKLSWLKEAKYYNLHIQPNLFGGMSVIKSWGSTVSGRGGHKIIFCESESEIMEIINDVKKKRKYRKYRLTKKVADYPTEELLKSVKASDHKKIIELIKPDLNINNRDIEGWTALKWASYCKNYMVTLKLLDIGADPNIADDKGCTALMEACWNGDAKMVQLLLKYGADTNLKNNKSETALTYAILGDHTQIVELLSNLFSQTPL